MVKFFLEVFITACIYVGYVYFLLCVVKLRPKRDKVVEDARRHGRVAVAHFTSLKLGFKAAYEYEAEGNVYGKSFALGLSGSERRQAVKAGTVAYHKYTPDDFPDMEVFWEKGRPDKAKFADEIGLGVPYLVAVFGPAIPLLYWWVHLLQQIAVD